MTPRIRLRPDGAADALVALAAVLLILLSVTGLTLKNGAAALLRATGPARSLLAPTPGEPSRHVLKNRAGSTASAASHRSSPQTGERRIVLGQAAESHHPGGSPDVVPALLSPGRHLPADLSDPPADASAQLVATTVEDGQRGRAPPATGHVV